MKILLKMTSNCIFKNLLSVLHRHLIEYRRRRRRRRRRRSGGGGGGR